MTRSVEVKKVDLRYVMLKIFKFKGGPDLKTLIADSQLTTIKVYHNAKFGIIHMEKQRSAQQHKNAAYVATPEMAATYPRAHTKTRNGTGIATLKLGIEPE